MTQRDFYEAIVAGTMNDEMQEFAKEAIAKLDATNEARRKSAEKKRAEKEAEKAPIRAALMAVMSAEAKTATQLIEEAGLEIKPQSVPSLLKPLVEEGAVVKTDVKVTGKGTQRGYVRADAECEACVIE